jgi:uncharacterized membrane protein YeaQ/YmgE (transglycosylase-associated protein family)
MFLAQGVLDDRISISITVEQLIAWIIIGLIAGLLASLFVRGRLSLAGAVLIGLVGAVIGGFIFFDLLDVAVTGSLARGIVIRWIDIVVAFVGAIIVLALTSPIYWRRL